MFQLSTSGGSGPMESLRQALTAREARRYRRRWLLRWRRRRLLLKFVAIELALVESPSESARRLHQMEADRVKLRLDKNAERLFR